MISLKFYSLIGKTNSIGRQIYYWLESLSTKSRTDCYLAAILDTYSTAGISFTIVSVNFDMDPRKLEKLSYVFTFDLTQRDRPAHTIIHDHKTLISVMTQSKTTLFNSVCCIDLNTE